MSKDSEKQSAQGFAARNEDCRSKKFELQGWPANTPEDKMTIRQGHKFRRENDEMIDRQKPTPVRSGK